ncbi:MAG TPA: DUF1624 domain-containing protein [Gammaproteobacteria bacterium]|nr:DUF1624 domain-containing protein [Gammaproteobacteria bacterium]
MEYILKQQRLHYLDVTRGIAIICMVIYHFCFDLDNFNYLELNMDTDLFWRGFRALIISLFLTTMGMSLALTHAQGICWSCLKKRTLLLGISAILVSIGSYLQFPESWIYFGILHFILFASWLGLLFLGKPWLSLITAIIILIGYFLDWLDTQALFSLLQQPLQLPPYYTEDLVTVFPWFAWVLIGIFLVDKGWYVYPQLQANLISKKVGFLGRHSLLIYMIHQPILFGIVMLFSSFPSLV